MIDKDYKKKEKYFTTSINASKKEMLVSAKQDKLVLSHCELRELVISRLKQVFGNTILEMNVLYLNMIKVLHKKILRGEPIVVDNLGVITKSSVYRHNMYNFYTKEYSDGGYYLTSFKLHDNFRRYFLNKANRKMLLERIIRRSNEFVRVFGKIRIINK